MARRFAASESIESYVWSNSRESDVAARLREETARLPQAGMQIGPDQAEFLALLVRAIGGVRIPPWA